jgi:uncharacterized protein YqjF (DUF2071 family)
MISEPSIAPAASSPLSPTPELREAARSYDGRAPHVMYQSWLDLLFLHWRISPALIQKTLPAGLYVDTFEGDAFIGVVPFLMRKIRPRGLCSVPIISNFLELNVRTYVHNAQGVPGVWFYSLDCNQPTAVWTARTFFHLPYFHARMSAVFENGVWTYRSHRQGSPETAEFRYRATGLSQESAPGGFEFYLLERYYLYSTQPSGQLYRGQVVHPPYQYRAVEIENFSTLPAELDGFTALCGPPIHQCASPGVHVKIHALQKL